MSLKEDVNKTTNSINSVIPGFVSTHSVNVDLDKSEEPCECQGMFIVQEMAPRLWFCKKHGRTGFNYITDIIRIAQSKANEKAKYFRFTFDELWDVAQGFRIMKRIQYENNGKTYYDEEYFEKDLKKFFQKLLNVKF
jgi:hypothetical protein